MKYFKYLFLFIFLFSIFLIGASDTTDITITIADSTQTTITDNNIPESFKLYPPYPNPFNPTCTIQLDIPENDNLRIIAYDINGRKVSEIYNGSIQPGKYKFNWNAMNFSSGIYFIKVITNKNNFSKKIMLLK
ncbi:MAG: T9SS type A sorting domain-containing protein [Candidatus Marinimicrobia bacterium]|nr:T9SS type A sorting domain-containing protein [Candidatus Neomarinimicrobiota bacterium]